MSLTPMTFVEASKGPGIDGIEFFSVFCPFFGCCSSTCSMCILCIAMSGLLDHLHSPMIWGILICLTVTTSDKPTGTKPIKVNGIFHPGREDVAYFTLLQLLEIMDICFNAVQRFLAM